MPAAAPIAKAEAATALGAHVHLVGATVDDSLAAAQERASSGGLAFLHPFNDPEVIAGQGGLGLELLTQVPDLARVLVPLGGGGLLCGTAIAVKSARPEVELIGVQVETCAPFPGSLRAGEPVAVDSALTIADGIAVKRPGALTLALIERWVDRVVVVGEDEIAEAMVFLLERAKLVVEGAGAVGVAALLGGHVGPAPGPGVTAIVLSGGNVDPGLLAQIARRHESQAGRRSVLLARLPDRPGSLAQLLALVGEHGANLLDVEHLREGFDLHVRESAVQLVVETRGRSARRSGDRCRASGRLRRAARRAVVPRRRDQRGDHAAALVGFGMPLDAEHEPFVAGLDRLGQLIHRGVAGDLQAAADLVDALMVVGLGSVLLLAGRSGGQ